MTSTTCPQTSASFPERRPLQHARERGGFEVRTRCWQGTKELKRGAASSEQPRHKRRGGRRARIWESDWQPWTHLVTTKIDTRIHQALNHISRGWELLYSRPLTARYPVYRFESSSCLLLLRLSTLGWPLSNLLPFTKLSGSRSNEGRKKKAKRLKSFDRPWWFNSEERGKKKARDSFSSSACVRRPVTIRIIILSFKTVVCSFTGCWKWNKYVRWGILNADFSCFF